MTGGQAKSGLSPIWRFRSLRWRLTFFYLGLLSVLLALFGVAQYFAAREVLFRSNADVLLNDYRQVTANFRRIAQPPAGLPQSGQGCPASGAPATRQPLLSQTFATALASRRISAALLDPSGGVIACAGAELNPGTIPLLPLDQYQDAARRHPKAYYIAAAGDPPANQLLVLVPIRSGGRFNPVVGLAQLSIPTDDIDRTLRLDRLLALAGSASVLLLALLLSPLIVGSALTPLKQMAVTAGALAGGDYQQRVNLPRSTDEIGKLALAFNDMAAGIEQAFEVRRQSEDRMRQFVADASHELRTPLTAIAGYIDVLLRRDQVDPEILQSSLNAMQRESTRMTRLVTDLLTLTRFESARAPARRPLVLDQWLSGALDELHLTDQGVNESRTLQPGIVVQADPDALKQVVSNLAQNAVKYAPGAEQRWSCYQENGRAAIRLADTGPGIASADLPHIFERFYRGEKARDRSTGGSGLGLSIVRSIVEAHGGTIEADSRPGAGATFTAWLPLEPSSS